MRDCHVPEGVDLDYTDCLGRKGKLEYCTACKCGHVAIVNCARYLKMKIKELEESYQGLSAELRYLLDKKNEKKPHRCPVCDGFGELILVEKNTCHACEGTGIVWG